MMGRVKTRVFPDPVKAMPIMSLPDRLHTNRSNVNDKTETRSDPEVKTSSQEC